MAGFPAMFIPYKAPVRESDGYTRQVVAESAALLHSDVCSGRIPDLTKEFTMTEAATDTAATDAETSIDAYLQAFGEPEPVRRRQLIGRAFGPEGSLTDPPLVGSGHDGLDEMFVAAQSHYVGHTFRRTSSVDVHHGFARYEWNLVSPDGDIAVTGTDFARIDDHGRLSDVVGFFGPVPGIES